MKNIKSSIAGGLLSMALLMFASHALAANVLFTLKPSVSHQVMLRHASSHLKAILEGKAVSKVYLAVASPNLISNTQVDIVLPLGEGKTADFKKAKANTGADGIVVWSGEVPTDRLVRYSSPNEVKRDDANAATLIRHGNRITGTFHKDGQLYQIWPVEHGLHAIVKIDSSKIDEGQADEIDLPNDGIKANSTSSLSHNSQQGRKATSKSAHSTIRVMLVTTNQSRARIPDMAALARLAFEEANQGAENSQVAITFENAGTFDANYNESGTQSEMLERVTDVSTPDLGRPAKQFRDQHRADLVVMLITTGSGSGYNDASATSAYSVVKWDKATGAYTFAHEMGHNIGTSHDLAQYPGGVPSRKPDYRHGYVRLASGGVGGWRTIMSYGNTCSKELGPCPRLNYFSNPNLTYRGEPMGTEQYQNNTRRLNERRDTVADFYPPPDGATSPVAVATATPSNFSGATTVALDGSGSSNPGGGELSYAWIQISGTPALTINDERLSRASVVVPAAASSTIYTFKLLVANANNQTDSKEVSVTAQPLTGPVARITGASSVETGKTVSLSSSTSTGTNLTYSWVAPSFTPSSSTTPNIILTAPSTTGNYDVQLTVRDALGRSNATVHPISVTPPSGNNCGDVAEWISTKTYSVYNEQILYLSKIYRSAFYSVGKPPDQNSGEFGQPWIFVRDCGESSMPVR